MTTEAQLQSHVLGLASFYGWRGYHAPDNRPGKSGRVQRVTPGFPDTVLIRVPELIVSELKTAKGRPTPAQLAWLDDFRELGAAIDELARDLDAAIRLLDGATSGLRDPALRRSWGRGRNELARRHANRRRPSVEAYLWRPADFDDVNARLSRGRTAVPPNIYSPPEAS